MSETKKQSQSVVTEEIMEELRHEFRSLIVDQVADVLGLERWRAYESLKQGKAPPHFKIGAIYRFPVARFRAWMAEKRRFPHERLLGRENAIKLTSRPHSSAMTTC